LVKSFALTYHPLVPLALVLKQLLYERGLSNTYGGGLSSYCLVLMIVSFLQTSVPQKDCDRSYEKTHSKNLGEQLMKFLEFYGRRFAYQSTGITVTDGGKHFALGAGESAWRTHGPPPLVILDPYEPSNNIAASAFGMHRVRAAFDFSFAVLNTAADSAGEGLALSLVLRTWSMSGQSPPSQAGRAQRTPSLLGRDSTPLPHRPNFTS
jgi:non-canonical poly(A) RNA polymerase PAPD5/7